MPTWSQMNLQEANSPLMEQLIFFHDHTLMILIMITTMVSYIMLSTIMNLLINRTLLESQKIELIWTIMPAITLIFIAMPSLRILYLMDEMNEPLLTIKSMGHQWYWSYEYSDFKNIEFDSYMKPTNELKMNEFRLLDVDNRIVLPLKTPIRMLISSTDVIHSWTIPSLGVKIDATPGRLNQGAIYMNRPTIMYGQCSEICGANHSFMPIVMESTSMNMFIDWIKNY
uniref:Cytochrome c oxidase subunit 2 n=1 Tax=Corythucha ciliata TaxID=369451 RepID=V5JFC2_CORCT|nr:cytochrome c oxidase subunit II [Corythucha ciliata]AGM48378.1 cytochrome c oxidase subunit II [Corythucha ciliata]WRW11491.1 cytochrome c oxidase subunit II [Corythucha ciliata]